MGQVVRILIILVVIWIAVQLIKRAFLPRPSTKNGQEVHSTRMIPCVVCGVHVPENQAVTQSGKVYCSKQHLPDTAGK